MLPLDGLVGAAMVFARLAGVWMVLPAFGMRGVPVLVRLAAALLTTAVVAPVVPVAGLPPTVAALAVGMVSESVVGLALGGAVRLAFGAVALAGEVVGDQMGHGAARLFDPVQLTTLGPVGALAGLLASAVFVGAGLHLALLGAVADSFFALPAGAAAQLGAVGGLWGLLAGVAIATGVRLAAPVIVLVFLVNAFVGLLTRLAPAMNVFFSIGFVITVAVAHAVIFTTFPAWMRADLELVARVVEAVPGMVAELGGR